jgi:predicted esterase
MNLRVQFAHGLESNPQGSKAQLLAAHFELRAPAMNTRDFESCVEVHAQTLHAFAPDLLIGSSFGGAVAVALLARGLWRGPTLLLAQAAAHYQPGVGLPPDVDVTLVHGLRDDVVPIAHSRALAKTGTPGRVHLIERDDDHRLSALIASGELIAIARRAACTQT